MNLTDKLEEIKIYGSLGYSANQIADALDLTNLQRAELILRLEIFDDELAIAYRKGFITAESKTDIALAKQAQAGDEKAIEIQAKRSHERKIEAIKKDLFGV